MSRSYRHTPVASKTDKFEKNYANRRVRHTNGLLNGGSYRKVYCSCLIGYKIYWEGDNRRK